MLLRGWGRREEEALYHLFEVFAVAAFRAEFGRNGSISALRECHAYRDFGEEIFLEAQLESGLRQGMRLRRGDRFFHVAHDIERAFAGRTDPDTAREVRSMVERIFHAQREEVVMDVELQADWGAVQQALDENLPNDQLLRLQERYHERRARIAEHRSVARQSYRRTERDDRLQRTQSTFELLRTVEIMPAPQRSELHQRLANLMGAQVDRVFVQEFHNPQHVTVYDSAAAQARGLKLLKENLTPKQLKQYETHNYFHVKGGESGKTYRILHGRQINIRELDKKHRIVCKWCFLPGGALVEGDVMLAQKFGLELQESEVLKVANRFPPDNERRMEGTQVWVDEAAAIPPAAWQGVDRAAPDGDRTVIQTRIQPRYLRDRPMWRADFS